MKKTITFDKALEIISESSLYGNMGLFVGSGFSKAVLSDQNIFTPYNWIELLNKASESLQIDIESILIGNNLSLPEVASKICREYAQNNTMEYSVAVNLLKETISDLVNYHPTSKSIERYEKLLYPLNLQWIITTNYDTLLESIFWKNSISYTPDELFIKPQKLIPIYHLHGIRHTPSSLIITQEDYIELFRPTEYRQIKLPLLLKESTTIFVGYGVGDINVLTAIDWSKNVFSLNKSNYCPNEVIQLLKVEKKINEPYIDEKGILIIEITDIGDFFELLNSNIIKLKEENIKHNETIVFIKSFLNDDKEIDNVINEKKSRIQLFDMFFWNESSLVNDMITFLDKIFAKMRIIEHQDYAFEEYKNHLDIIFDIFHGIGKILVSPVYINFLANELVRLSNYIGKGHGQSHAAYKFWNSYKHEIPDEIWSELKSFANCNIFGRELKRLLVR